MKAEEIINWSKLSELMTGNKTYIRPNRVPLKYKERVFRLLALLEEWETMKNS